MPGAAWPPELESLQRTIYAVISDPAGARRAVRARPAALALLHDGPPIDRETRLSVYGDAYFLRALEALSSDHAATRRALGELGFQALVAEYLASHPSTSPSLSDLGAGFPSFVAAHRLSRRIPFLPDLARLERAALETLLTSRLPPLDPEFALRVPAETWGRARLVLDPTIRVLDLAWPVLGLWRRRDDASPGRTLRRPGARTVLLWRDEVWTQAEMIERVQGALLRRLMSGEALGRLFADSAVTGAQATLWFGRWMRLGLIRGLEER